MPANTPKRISDLSTEAQFDAYMEVFQQPEGTRLNDLDAIVAAAVEYSVRVMAPAFVSLDAGLRLLQGSEGLPPLRTLDLGSPEHSAFEMDAPDGSGAHAFVLDFSGRHRPVINTIVPDLPRRISCYLLGPGAAVTGTTPEIETALAARGPELVFSIDVPAISSEGVLALPGSARVEDSGAALVALRAVAEHMERLGCGKLLQTRHDWAGHWKLDFRGPKRERLMAALGVATVRADGVAPGQRMADGLMYLQAIAAAADLWHEAEDLGRLILGLQTGGHDDYESRFVSADGVQEAFLAPTAQGGVIALRCFETHWLLKLKQNSPDEMPYELEIHCAAGIAGELETSDETLVAEIGLSMQGYSSKMIVPFSGQAMRELTGALGTISDLGVELVGKPEPACEGAYLC